MWHVERWVAQVSSFDPLLVPFYTDLPPIINCYTYSVFGWY